MFSRVVESLFVVLAAVLLVSIIVVLTLTVGLFFEFVSPAGLLSATGLCLLLQAVDSVLLNITVKESSSRTPQCVAPGLALPSPTFNSRSRGNMALRAGGN